MLVPYRWMDACLEEHACTPANAALQLRGTSLLTVLYHGARVRTAWNLVLELSSGRNISKNSAAQCGVLGYPWILCYFHNRPSSSAASKL